MEDNWTPPSDAEVTDWSPPSDAQVVDETVKKKVTPSPSQVQSSSNGLNLLSGVIPSGKALLTGQKGESVQIDQKPIDLTNAPIAEDESTRTDKFIRKPIDKKKVDEIYNLSKQNESLIDEFAKSHFVLDNLSQSEAIKQLNDLYAKREQAKDPQTAQAIDTQIEVIKSQPVEKQPSIQEAVLQNAQKYGSQPQDFNRPEIPMNPLTPNQILERNGMKTANTVGELHDRYIESANKLNELRPELDKTATELDAFKKETRTADFKTDKSGNKTLEGLADIPEAFGHGFGGTMKSIEQGFVNLLGDKQDRIDYAKKRYLEDNILYPTRTKGMATSGAEMVGGVAPYVISTAVLPETALLGHVITNGLTMGASGYGNGYYEMFAKQKQQGASDEEADAIAIQNAKFEGAKETAIGASLPFMGGAGSKLFLAPAEKSAMKQFLATQGVIIPTFTAGKLASNVYQKYGLGEKDVNLGDGLAETAENGLILGAMMEFAHKAPTKLKEIYRAKLSSAYPSIQQAVDKAVQDGVMDASQAGAFTEKLKRDYAVFNAMPKDITTEQKLAIEPEVKQIIELSSREPSAVESPEITKDKIVQLQKQIAEKLGTPLTEKEQKAYEKLLERQKPIKSESGKEITLELFPSEKAELNHYEKRIETAKENEAKLAEEKKVAEAEAPLTNTGVEEGSGVGGDVELPNYGKTVDTKMGKVDLVIEPNTQSENKNSIKVSAYDENGNTLGFSSAVIDTKNKTLTVKVSQIKDKYHRNGIYSKIIDEYEAIAKDKGLKLEREVEGETKASKDFWNNREKEGAVQNKINEIAKKFKSVESELKGTIDVEEFSTRLKKRYDEINEQYGEDKANEVLDSEAKRADKIIKEHRDSIAQRLKAEYFKKNGNAPSSIRDFKSGIKSGEYKIDDLPSYKDAVNAGLELPKAVEQSLKETTKAETPTTTQESNVVEGSGGVGGDVGATTKALEEVPKNQPKSTWQQEQDAIDSDAALTNEQKQEKKVEVTAKALEGADKIEINKKQAILNAEKIDKGSGSHVKKMSLGELNELARDMISNEKYYQDKLQDAQGVYNLAVERIQELSESYHKAKSDGSNPELVKAVEDLLGKAPTQYTEAAGVSGSALKDVDRISNKEIKTNEGEINTGVLEEAKDIPNVNKVIAKDKNGNDIKVVINGDKLKGTILSRNGTYLFKAMEGRVFTLAKVGNFYLPFYISSAGTSGKIQGQWYPFFGYNNWLVKGHVGKSGEMEYSKNITEVQNLLNENFIIPAQYLQADNVVAVGEQFVPERDANGKIIREGKYNFEKMIPNKDRKVLYDLTKDIDIITHHHQEQKGETKLNEHDWVAEKTGLNPKKVINDGKGSADNWIKKLVELTETKSKANTQYTEAATLKEQPKAETTTTTSNVGVEEGSGGVGGDAKSEFTDVGYMAARKKADGILENKKEATPIIGIRNAGSGSGVFVPFRIVKDEWIDSETTKREEGETFIYDDVNDKYYNVKDFSKSELDFLTDRDNFSEQSLKETTKAETKVAEKGVEEPITEEIKTAIDNGEITREQVDGFTEQDESAIEDIERKAESEDETELNSAIEQADKLIGETITRSESKTEPSNEKVEGGEVKKTLVTKRAYEGSFREGVKKELEAIGLTRETENFEKAEIEAKKFFDEYGEDVAIEAMKAKDIEGALGAFVWNEITKSVDKKLSEATDTAEIEQLQKKQAEILDIWGKQQRGSGAFNAAMAKIYETSELGYSYEKQKEKWEGKFGEPMPKDIAEKFKQYDTELSDLKKRITEAEKKVKEAEEKQAFDNIVAEVRQKPRTERSGKRKIAEGLDELTNALGVKLSAVGDKKASATKALIKIGEGLIEEGIATAKNVAEKIREYVEDKFKGKIDIKEYEPDVLKHFEETLPKITERNGKIHIPDKLIKELVKNGAETIEDLVSQVKEIAKEDFPDITDREIRDSITKYGKTQNPTKDEILSKISRMKRIGRLISQLEDVQNKIRPLKSGLQRERMDAEERAMNKQLREELRNLPVDEETLAGQIRTVLDARKQGVQNRIEDLQREIEQGEKTPKNQRTIADDEALTKLKEQLEKVKAEHQEKFAEQNEAEKEAKRLSMAKKNTQKRIEDLTTRLREGNFSKVAKKEIKEDAEFTKLRAEKIRIQEEFDKEFHKQELLNKKGVEKLKDRLWEIWSLPRALMATGEMSFVGVQGLINTIAHPIESAKAMKRAVEFAFSEKKTEQWLNEIKSQEYYPIMKKSKLSLTEPNAELTVREELFYSGWTNMIWNALGRPLKLKSDLAYERWKELNPMRGVERASVGYLDTQRVSRFLDGMEMLKQKGITYEENPQAYKDVADVVNTFTGRASLGKLQMIAPTLSKVFFSPRNWASALKTATPYALYHFGKMRADAGGFKPSTAQKMAISDLSKFVGVTTSMVMMAAATLNNDDDESTGVEFDPRSSDFMKIKIGDKRIDPWGGKIQQIIFSSRVLMDALHEVSPNLSEGGYKKKDEVMPLGVERKSPTLESLSRTQATNKLAPTMALLNKYASTKIGKDGKRKDEFGNDFELSEEAKKMLKPIYWGTVSELLKEDPSALNGLLAFYAFFGGGVNIYGKKKEKKKD